jgi:beta-phosphoglucomutase-like phosphatase (HAD superfamily)
MDGLMLDTERPIQAHLQTIATDLGFDLDDTFYLERLVGRGWTDCDAALMAHFGASFPMRTFTTRFQAEWTQTVATLGIARKTGLDELLALLETKQVPMAVATSTQAAEAERSLRAAGIRERFPLVVTGDQVTHGKPAPDIYLKVAQQLGLTPDRCVALEDSTAGVLAGHAAGMTMLMVPEASRPPSVAARAAAHAVLKSLHDARRLIETWLEEEK